MELFSESAYLPFAIALYALIALVLLQVLFFIIGADIFSIADELLPDVEVDAEAGLHKALSFVGMGKVPTMVVVMAFLATFSTIGYSLQKLCYSITEAHLSVLLATIAAFIPSFIATGTIARAIGRILPAEETYAVSEKSLIGRKSTIISGEASYYLPADAIVIDAHQNHHNIYVKASSPEEVFYTGDEVTIVSKVEGFYIVSIIQNNFQ